MVRSIDLRSPHSHQPPEARSIALQPVPHVPSDVRSDHHSISPALHVTPAAFLWATRSSEYGFGISDRILSADVEGCFRKQHRAATRVADDLCCGPDPGRPSVAGIRAARRVVGVAVLQSICANTLFRLSGVRCECSYVGWLDPY